MTWYNDNLTTITCKHEGRHNDRNNFNMKIRLFKCFYFPPLITRISSLSWKNKKVSYTAKMFIILIINPLISKYINTKVQSSVIFFSWENNSKKNETSGKSVGLLSLLSNSNLICKNYCHLSKYYTLIQVVLRLI